MIKKGDTIVYKTDNATMFYWLCDITDKELLFFDWYANPYRATSADYWKVTSLWFQRMVEDGNIEIYPSLPLDKYGDVFEKQAVERNK